MGSTYELDDVEVTQTAGLMKQIQQHIAKLKDLRWKMLEAEEAFKEAEKAYTDFSCKVMPDLFKMNGLDSLQTEDGRLVRIVTKTRCSVNKNEQDKKTVIKWLREHGGESLINSQCIVPISQKDKLSDNGITFEEDISANTNSVKAFVLDLLGQKGSPASITVEDLPKGLNFYQYDEVEIS